MAKCRGCSEESGGHLGGKSAALNMELLQRTVAGGVLPDAIRQSPSTFEGSMAEASGGEPAYVNGAFRATGGPGTWWRMYRPRFAAGQSAIARYARKLKRYAEEEDEDEEDEGGFLSGIAAFGATLSTPESILCDQLRRYKSVIMRSDLILGVICRSAICPNLPAQVREEALGEYGAPSGSSRSGRSPGYDCDVLCQLMMWHDRDALWEVMIGLCGESEAFARALLALVNRYG